MAEIAFDPATALKVLNDHAVEYVIVGGFGAQILGSPVVTQDCDICYSRDDANIERLAAALLELKAQIRGVEPGVAKHFRLDAKTLKLGDSFTFVTTAGSLDILGTPKGIGWRGYHDLTAGAVEAEVYGLRVKVASINDLIAMKRAAGRPKDLVQLENLAALREEREKRGLD